MWSYYGYQLLFILNIIDVKLTFVRLTAYQFVWIGRRRAGLISFSLLGEYLRIAGATSVVCQFSVLDRLWSTMLSFMIFLIYLCCWDLPICRVWIFMLVMYLWVDDMAIWDLCYLSTAMFVEKFYACLFGEFFKDVTSISWVFIIFTCFIALIEVGVGTKCV